MYFISTHSWDKFRLCVFRQIAHYERVSIDYSWVVDHLQGQGIPAKSMIMVSFLMHHHTCLGQGGTSAPSKIHTRTSWGHPGIHLWITRNNFYNLNRSSWFCHCKPGRPYLREPSPLNVGVLLSTHTTNHPKLGMKLCWPISLSTHYTCSCP